MSARMPRVPDSPEGVALGWRTSSRNEGKATRRAAAGYDRAVPEMSGGGDRRRDHQHPALDPRHPSSPRSAANRAGFRFMMP